MLSDFLDDGSASTPKTDDPSANQAAPLTNAQAVPWGQPMPTAPSAASAIPSDSYSGGSASNLGNSLNPDAVSSPTSAMAPGIPSNPYAGVAGMTADPLAFAPFTPSAPDAPQITANAPYSPSSASGGANYAPDTSGFPGGDPGLMAQTGPVGGGESLPPAAPATSYLAPGPAQMAPDVSGDLANSAPPSAMSAFLGNPSAPSQGATYTAPIASGLPPDQTTPLTNAQAIPYVPPDQRGPDVPTYQAPAYIPPDLAVNTPTPTPIVQPTDSGAVQNSPADIQPTFAPVPVNNPTLPAWAGGGDATPANVPTQDQPNPVVPPDLTAPAQATYRAPSPTDAGGFVPTIASNLPPDQSQPLQNVGQIATAPTSTYQPPAYIPPDLTNAAPPVATSGQPTDSGAVQNSPNDIQPTLPPVPVNNPTSPLSLGNGSFTPPDVPTQDNPNPTPPSALNVNNVQPAATATPTAPVDSGTGTPTPAAVTPLPANLTPTDVGGDVAQGQLPPVSVNQLNTPAAQPTDQSGTSVTTPLSVANAASNATSPATSTATSTATDATSALNTPNVVAPFDAASIPNVGTSLQPALSTVTPDNALTNQQIQVAPTADRFALANQKFSDFVNSSDPAYQAALREATQRSAAAGGLGSGMLRTSYGNAELARENAMNTARNQFMTDALQGTIGDAYNNAQLAAQQQGFQNQQQQQAFQQAVTQQQLQDQLTNSAFARASQQLASGSTGSPVDTGLLLSNLFGNQASQAGSAVSGIANGLQAQQNADRQYQLMLAYLNGQGVNPYTGQNATTGLPTTGGVSGAPNQSALPQGISDWLNTYNQQPQAGQQQTTTDPYAGIDPVTGLPYGQPSYATTGGTY